MIDRFEQHWGSVRGAKRAERELKRREGEPQVYACDSANRHRVTWLAAHADAQAEIARLRGALERLADCAQRCDSWESFPQGELDAAYAALKK